VAKFGGQNKLKNDHRKFEIENGKPMLSSLARRKKNSEP